MRRYFFAIAFFALTAAGWAQSGVLLGVHISGGSAGDSYRTYWIVSGESKPQLSATLPDLVIPRKDGFWRIGVYQHSYNRRYEPGSIADILGDELRYFQDREEKLYLVPVGDTPRVEIAAEDPSPAASPNQQKSTKNEVQKSGDGEQADQHADDDSGQPCSTDDVEITYVDPQNIGLARRSSVTEYCSPSRYATFGSNEFIAIDQATAPDIQRRGINILDRLTPIQKKQISKAASWDLDNDLSDDDILSFVSLTVAHDGGRWRLLGWREGSTATHGGQGFQSKAAVPAGLVPSTVTAATSTIAATLQGMKGLKDFFTSPAGDMVIGISGKKLVAYRIAAGKLDGPVELAQLAQEDTAAHATPVMAEWSTGKWVAAWDKQMTGLKLPPVAPHTEVRPEEEKKKDGLRRR